MLLKSVIHPILLNKLKHETGPLFSRLIRYVGYQCANRAYFQAIFVMTIVSRLRTCSSNNQQLVVKFFLNSSSSNVVNYADKGRASLKLRLRYYYHESDRIVLCLL